MIGKVYILRAGSRDLFKIGHTYQSVESRIQQVQTGCPYPLHVYKEIEVVFPEDLEKVLHRFFSEYRLNGEWFEVTPAMIDDALDAPSFEPFAVTATPIDPINHQVYITLNSFSRSGDEISITPGCVTAGELQYHCLQLIKSLLKIYAQAGKFTSIDERGHS